MTQVWRAFSGVVPYVVLVAVGVCLLIWIDRRWSRARLGTSSRRSAVTGSLFAYCCGLLMIALSPSPNTIRRSVVLSPWDRSGFTDLLHTSMNLALLIPLGFLIRMRWPGLPTRRMVVAGSVPSLGLELAQYALGVGRVTSSSDALLGMVGVAIGIAAAELARARLWPGVKLTAPTDSSTRESGTG